MRTLTKRIVRYVRDITAVTAVAFAVTIPLVIGSAGMGVDLAMTYMVRQRLSHAVDAAALAAAAAASSGADIQQKVNEFFAINYPPNKIGATYDLTVEQRGSDLVVSAKANVDTYFIQVLGVSQVVVEEEAVVRREIRALEVAMVLDVTGSMSTNNNIAALRNAASTFTNILFNSATYPDTVKIGLVPFAGAVNVGPYGLGRNPNNTVYDTAFVRNPNNLSFNQSNSNQWWGCVLDTQPHPMDTQNSDTTWRWDMYRYNNSGARNTAIRNQSAAPNTNCNRAYILPLTSNRTTILSRISGLQANGTTLSNIGMVWGFRVLSPEFPFREGKPWDDPVWKKAAILMTDGDNNIGDVYSAYGPWNNLRLTDSDLDQRLALTCQNMKDKGITVYTITFTSGINATTKNFFRNCATDTNKYFDAPSQADLQDAFEQIARELSNIHLTQ
jgi:Flp pilus assembly protein TadG